MVVPAEEEAQKILQTAKTEEAEIFAQELIDNAKEKVRKFWKEFDRIPRGLVAADQAFPKDWDITEALVKELVEKIKKWSKDYEDANKGGRGACSDGGHIQPVTGS